MDLTGLGVDSCWYRLRASSMGFTHSASLHPHCLIHRSRTSPVLGLPQAGKGRPLIPAEGSLFLLLLVLCSSVQPEGVETSTDFLLDGLPLAFLQVWEEEALLLTKLNPCGRGSCTLSSPGS